MFRKLWDKTRKDPYVILLHVGTACGLIGFAFTDPLYLRLGSNLSEGAAIAFNLTRLPFPIWTPVYWSGAFMTVNTYNIALLLNDRKTIDLTEEEEELYNRTFRKSGMRPAQFRRLIEAGKERVFQKGEVIFREGDISNTVYLLKTGSVVVSLRGDFVASVDSNEIGAFIGEMQLLETFGDYATLQQHQNTALPSPSTGNASTGVYPGKSGALLKTPEEGGLGGVHRKHNTVTVTDTGSVTAVEWDMDYLLQVLEEQDELAASLRSVLLCTLLKKLRRSSNNHNDVLEKYYKDELKRYTATGALTNEDKERLSKIAIDHCISVRFHNECLKEIGWSQIEFAVGKKG